ncbi:MAG TPA: CDP-alcohol phosphatidyltransferase family protein [Anaerolineae bacterium]|nr:CDP-alcohol phosphatidyltransferase family protein [Anaerolineae bacterium]
MNNVADKEQKSTLTSMLRIRFKNILDPIGAFLNRLGIKPNTLTILGLVGNTFGAFFLAKGQIVLGGLMILAMGPIDALDGTMARLRGEPSKFGAFVDSVTDRYSELVIYFGLLVYFIQLGNWMNISVVYLAAAGSVLVSYTRARAESLGYDVKIGLLTRLERYFVLMPTLILNIPMVGAWLIAIFANITAIQRILYIRKQARSKLD